MNKSAQPEILENDAIRYYLSDACLNLGFVHVSAVEWMAGFIERYAFEASHFARSLGTPMDAEERKSFKLGNLKMTREAWAALTEKGRAIPGRGIEITMQRAMASVSREREQQAILDDTNVKYVRFQCFDPCAAAQEYISTIEILPKEQMPRFPLNKCSKAICQCSINRHYENNHFDDRLNSENLYTTSVGTSDAESNYRRYWKVIIQILLFIGVTLLINGHFSGWN